MPQTAEQRMANLAKANAVRAAKRAAKKAQGVSTPIKKEAALTPPGEPEELSGGAVFDVEEAPDGTFSQDSALDKVFKKLGLKGTTEEKQEARTLPTAKLTKAQQSLYDSFAPLAIQAFIVSAGWMWSLMGQEYKILAPSDEVAEKIVAPIMRVYARESQIAASLNPNHTDIAASLAALVGYAWTSIMLYQEIKQEKEEYGEYRPARPAEVRHDSENDGRNAIRANAHDGRATAESNGHKQPDIDISHLTESEQRSYKNLSRLRDLDYASRARRSGRS
jgi:hypothetical protein